ncbi:MAG TPA: hypothetical protein VHZ03_32075 [Trebonia sp.]|nr:hypothetical protein [Trebonia sp.]
MPSTPCPFCFTTIDSSNLGYLCARQGHIKCDPVQDPARLQITGNGTPTGLYIEPASGKKGVAGCPTCQGQTRRRACPVCHTGLSIDFVGTKNPMLGMVGSKGAGKTVLATVMIQQLRKVISHRFGADLSLATDNPDGMNSITEYMQEREQDLYKKENLPQATQTYEAGKGRVPIVLRWRADKKSTMLAFLDSAGEDFLSEETSSAIRYLQACEFLIVALDPFSLPGARDQLSLPPKAVQGADNASVYTLHQITTKLRTSQGKANRKIQVPVAIAFTKMDAFFPSFEEDNPLLATAPAVPSYNEADGLAVHEQIRTLLKEWDAWEIETHMSQYYEDYRYFGVSALGAQPDYDQGHVAAGGVRPHRVEDPILWLMSKAKMVKAVKPK